MDEKTQDFLSLILSQFDERDRDIIKMRYGISSTSPKSAEVVSKIFGTTPIEVECLSERFLNCIKAP